MFRLDQVEDIPIDAINISDKRRSLNDDAVKNIAESMKAIGLLTPITVRNSPQDNDDDRLELITGHHRIAAAISLGWIDIECIVRDCDELEARMWEISENLHRSELTVLERAEQIEEWRKLVKERGGNLPPLGGRQPNAAGVNATARELNTSAREVRRAKKIASLSGPAKDAAKSHGLADNQSALMDAAAMATPEAQVHYLETRPQSPADRPLNDFEAREKQVSALMSAWNRASLEARQEFLSRIDQPLMDKAGQS